MHTQRRGDQSLNKLHIVCSPLKYGAWTHYSWHKKSHKNLDRSSSPAKSFPPNLLLVVRSNALCMLKHYFGKALHNYCGRFKKRNKARNERKKKTIPCLPSAEKAFVNPHLKCAHIEFLCRKVVWLSAQWGKGNLCRGWGCPSSPCTVRRSPGHAPRWGRWPVSPWRSLLPPGDGSLRSPVGWWRWPASLQPIEKHRDTYFSKISFHLVYKWLKPG